MILAQNRNSLDRFEALVRAAQVLAVAGLAGDNPEASRFISMASHFFSVPYTDERPVEWIGAPLFGGAFKEIVDALCERSKTIAPTECNVAGVIKLTNEMIKLEAPRSVSAHEVIEASILLAAGLVELGLDAAEVERLIALR